MTAEVTPMSQAFAISLPESTTAVEGPGGALAFTDASGATVAVTTAPWAKTAAGQWIPSSLTYRDGALVQEVVGGGADTSAPTVAGFDFFAIAAP
jgi:hypothetical protein